MLRYESTWCFIYLFVSFYGIRTDGSVNVIICEDKTGELKCDCMNTIRVLSANYGRTEPGHVHCNHHSIENLNCINDVQNQVSQDCDEHKTCTIRANNENYGDMCPQTYKYMDINYECVHHKIETPTIVCPDNIIECGNLLVDSANVTWELSNVTDFWNREVVTSESVASGSILPIGQTFINVTAYVKGCEDTAFCSFEVIVKDCSLSSCQSSTLTAECLLSLGKQSVINQSYTEYDIANLAVDIDMILINAHNINEDNPTEIYYPYFNVIVSSLKIEESNNYTQFINFSSVSVHLGFNYTGQVTVVIVLWEYDFFRTPQLSDHVNDYRNETYYLNSGLLSITTYDENGTEITGKVQYSIQMMEIEDNLTKSMNYNVTPVCGYIDLEIQQWSTSGCYVAEINITQVVCRCDHLTSFGVLMQVTSYETDTYETLSDITNIGLIISTILLIITEVVYFNLRDLWKSLRNNIHKNLIGNMIVFNILFLVGIDKIQYEAFCKTVTVLLHYFLMDIFFWMLAETVFLIFKVIYTKQNSHNKLRNYMICCYVSPLIFVLPVAIFNFNSYGRDICWLDPNLNWVVVAPALIIILFSIVILIVMIRIIWQRAGTNVQALEKDKQEYRKLKKSLKGVLFLIPIVGVTWIFGPLNVNKNTVFLQYIFVILNAFQGVFIFLVYCLLDNEVHAHWKNIRKKQSKVHTINNDTTCTGGKGHTRNTDTTCSIQRS